MTNGIPSKDGFIWTFIRGTRIASTKIRHFKQQQSEIVHNIPQGPTPLGQKWLMDYNSEAAPLSYRCCSVSAAVSPYPSSLHSLLFTTAISHHSPCEVSALKGEITPIQSVSMGTISRQVQKIALFVMKVIYTCSCVELDMLPHCRPVSAKKALYQSPSRFLAFFYLRHTYTHTSRCSNSLELKSK